MSRSGYTATFVPARGTDGVRLFRRLLKFAGRQLGMRCVNAHETFVTRSSRTMSAAANSVPKPLGADHKRKFIMMKNEAFPSKYFKAEDVKGRPVVVTIAGITTDKIGQPPKEKRILLFEDAEKQLVLNGTNWDLISDITGQDDSDLWPGHKIALVAARVPFGREMVDAIRVRAPMQAAKAPTRQSGNEPPPVEDESDFGR
jgi:hypothetical protein